MPDSKLLLTGRGTEECSDQLLEICFETFRIPKLAIVPNCVLALYGSGRTDGTIVDVGHGLSTVDFVWVDKFLSPQAKEPSWLAKI